MNDQDKKTLDQQVEKDTKSMSFLMDKVSIFQSDPYFVFVFKKSQKIATALYMITDFFSDSEPIKWSIRNKSISLLDSNMSLSVTSSPNRKILLDTIIQSAVSLVSFLEIGYFSGIISEMNYLIIKGELEKLISIIESRELPAKLGRNLSIAESFLGGDFQDDLESNFSTPTSPSASDSSPSSILGSNQTHSSSIVKSFQSSSISSPILHSQQNKPRLQTASSSHFYQEGPQIKGAQKDMSFKHKDINNVLKNEGKSSRKESIISILRKKGDLSIKDISDTINDCSEKTIQRELLALVSSGVLKKEGERRWSRYSLI